MSHQSDATQPHAAIPAWDAASATARGSSHVRSGLPNQDAALVRELPDGSGVVAAVADGHGGARYVRSDVGAAFAVAIACELGARFATERGADRDRSIQRRAAVELVPQLVDRWMASVRDHAAQHPFVDEERSRAGVDLDEDIAFAYGATLLFTIATPGWVLIGQLGDGDVLVVDSDMTVTRPVPRDSRLVAGQTTSLCLPDAPRDLRLTVLPPHEVETLVLASDGYGNSFAGADWWQAVGRDMQTQVRNQGLASVAASLPEWAADSAEVGGDDVTIAILGRRAVSRAPDAALAATMPVALPAEPPVERGRARRGGIVVALVVIVTIAVIAAIAAFALASDGSDADDDVTPVPTPTTIDLPDGSTTAPAPLGDRAALRITSPADTETWVATSPFVVTGVVDPTSTVALVTNGGDAVDVPVGDDGSWSYPVDLVELENVVQITVTDRRPELDPRTEERKIVFDPTRPAITIDSPANGSSHDGTVTVSGHADAFSDIYLDDTKVAETGFGDTWSFSVTVTRDVALRLTAHDRLGPGNAATLLLRHRVPATTTTTPPPGPPTTTAAPPAPPTTTALPPGSGGANPAPGGQAGTKPTLPPEMCARPDLPEDVRRTSCP